MTVVRLLRPTEWQRYRELRLAALLDAPSAFASTWPAESARPDAEWRSRAERLAAARDSVLYVAVGDDGGWRGLAGGYRPATPPADAELVSMWVAPPARRTGLARRLVLAVAEWTAASGGRTLGLWVTRTNTPAIGLYQSLGFEPTGDVQPLPSDPCRDEQRMLLRLGPPAGGSDE